MFKSRFQRHLQSNKHKHAGAILNSEFDDDDQDTEILLDDDYAKYFHDMAAVDEAIACNENSAIATCTLTPDEVLFNSYCNIVHNNTVT